MRKCLLLLVAAGLLAGSAGCVSVKAPETVTVGGGHSRPEPVDSDRVPHPDTLDEAQRELNRAYANLRYLERENARLADKAAKYKRERDRYKDQRDDYKDRLEKYEED